MAKQVPSFINAVTAGPVPQDVLHKVNKFGFFPWDVVVVHDSVDDVADVRVDVRGLGEDGAEVGGPAVLPLLSLVSLEQTFSSVAVASEQIIMEHATMSIGYLVHLSFLRVPARPALLAVPLLLGHAAVVALVLVPVEILQ